MKKGTQNSEKDEIQQISLAANGPIFGSMLLEFETYHRQKYHTIPLFFHHAFTATRSRSLVQWYAIPGDN